MAKLVRKRLYVAKIFLEHFKRGNPTLSAGLYKKSNMSEYIYIEYRLNKRQILTM